MNTFNRLFVLVTAVALTPFSDSKAADFASILDNPTFYASAGAGRTSLDTGVTNVTGTAKLDEDDVGYKIFGGVNLNKYLSAEVFYADLGEASLSGNNGDTFNFKGTTYTFTANNVNINVTGKSFGVVPIVGYDVNEYFRPFVKVGLQRWDYDADITSSAGSASLSDSGTDAILGLGAQFTVTDNIKARVEFEQYRFDDEDVEMISANFVYAF